MITMVIFTYNHAHYLPIQIASIIRQGSNISKIIVVNDGSTDNTADVLEKIQINEPRLVIKNLTANVGWMQAAHIGLSYVETDFFAFAAADDFLLSGWAEKSLDALLSAPSAAICLSRTFVVSETPFSLTKTVFPKKISGTVLSPREFHRTLMRYGVWMDSNTVLYRRSAYDDKFVEFESAGAFSDGLTLCTIGLKAGAVLVDEPLGVFFERSGSVSAAVLAPTVGVSNVQKLSHLLRKSPCVELIDRRLAFRILRLNTYTYLVSSVHNLTSEFSELAKSILPPMPSRAFRISLRFLFNLYRLTVFFWLRPFDIIKAKKNSSDVATLDEKHAFFEYQKALNDSLPSMGVDS